LIQFFKVSFISTTCSCCYCISPERPAISLPKTPTLFASPHNIPDNSHEEETQKMHYNETRWKFEGENNADKLEEYTHKPHNAAFLAMALQKLS
jgi:hypothetical protein